VGPCQNITRRLPYLTPFLWARYLGRWPRGGHPEAPNYTETQCGWNTQHLPSRRPDPSQEFAPQGARHCTFAGYGHLTTDSPAQTPVLTPVGWTCAPIRPGCGMGVTVPCPKAVIAWLRQINCGNAWATLAHPNWHNPRVMPVFAGGPIASHSPPIPCCPRCQLIAMGPPSCDMPLRDGPNQHRTLHSPLPGRPDRATPLDFGHTVGDYRAQVSSWVGPGHSGDYPTRTMPNGGSFPIGRRPTIHSRFTGAGLYWWIYHSAILDMAFPAPVGCMGRSNMAFVKLPFASLVAPEPRCLLEEEAPSPFPILLQF